MRKILKESNFIIGVEGMVESVVENINTNDIVKNTDIKFFDVIEESVFENISNLILKINETNVSEANVKEIEFNKVNLTFISDNLNSLTFIIYFNIFLQIILLIFLIFLYFTCLKSSNLNVLKRINSKYQV